MDQRLRALKPLHEQVRIAADHLEMRSRHVTRAEARQAELEDRVQRELQEEAGVLARAPVRRGMLEFEMLPKDADAERTAADKMLARGLATVLEVHVFTATNWDGEPAESEPARS